LRKRSALRSFLLAQRIAEQPAEQADVFPQRLVFVRGGRLH
jgi:hypothetical protein